MKHRDWIGYLEINKQFIPDHTHGKYNIKVIDVLLYTAVINHHIAFKRLYFLKLRT